MLTSGDSNTLRDEASTQWQGAGDDPPSVTAYQFTNPYPKAKHLYSRKINTMYGTYWKEVVKLIFTEGVVQINTYCIVVCKTQEGGHIVHLCR